MESAARAAEARLIKAGIQLTLGGEPTFVPLEPEGAEWSVTADGPTKLPIARRLGQELQLSAWPGSTMLYCPGKRYDGEVNPRWKRCCRPWPTASTTWRRRGSAVCCRWMPMATGRCWG